MKSKKKFPKHIQNFFNERAGFSQEVNALIEQHKHQKLSVLSTLYLRLETQIETKVVQPSEEAINALTALKFLIEKKQAKRDLYKTLIVAIITPAFSIIISILVSMLIKFN